MVNGLDIRLRPRRFGSDSEVSTGDMEIEGTKHEVPHPEDRHHTYYHDKLTGQERSDSSDRQSAVPRNHEGESIVRKRRCSTSNLGDNYSVNNHADTEIENPSTTYDKVSPGKRRAIKNSGEPIHGDVPPSALDAPYSEAEPEGEDEDVADGDFSELQQPKAGSSRKKGGKTGLGGNGKRKATSPEDSANSKRKIKKVTRTR